MHALLTKGNDKVRITTSATQVITNYAGTPLLPLTVANPEAAAQERVDSFLADGWTLVEKD